MTPVKILIDGVMADAEAAHVLGVWAAVKDARAGKGYSITHLPSGMRALSCGSKALAVRVIKGLPQVGLERWDAGRDGPEVLKACARMGVRAGAYNEFAYGACP